MPTGTVIRAKPKPRIDCLGKCGKRVDMRYNPNGLCRKCQKKLEAGKLRIENRQERGTYANQS